MNAKYWTKKRIMATDWKVGSTDGSNYPFKVYDPETTKVMGLTQSEEMAHRIIAELKQLGYSEIGQ